MSRYRSRVTAVIKRYRDYFREREGTSRENPAVAFDPIRLKVGSSVETTLRLKGDPRVTRWIKFTLTQLIIAHDRTPHGFYRIRQWVIGITFWRKKIRFNRVDKQGHTVWWIGNSALTQPSLVLSNLSACPHLHTPAGALRARLSVGVVMSLMWCGLITWLEFIHRFYPPWRLSSGRRNLSSPRKTRQMRRSRLCRDTLLSENAAWRNRVGANSICTVSDYRLAPRPDSKYYSIRK